jgi:hypothetical protein
MRSAKPRKYFEYLFCVLSALSLLTLLCRAGLTTSRDVAEQPVGSISDWREVYPTMFGAGFQRKISDEADTWRVSLVSWMTCPQAASNTCFKLKIESRIGAASSEFYLSNETAQVDAITIINSSRAAILGRAMHNMYVVTILGLPSTSPLDRFLCYWPALSPDRRFVAYEKFSPAHPGQGFSPSAEYLVYDLTESPEGNRTPPNRGRPLEPYDVGWPLYPEGVNNAPGDNMFEGRDVPVHWFGSEGFFWLHQSATVAFVDRWKGVSRLVHADVSRGVAHPNVTVFPIDPVDILDLLRCKSQMSLSDFKAWSKDPSTLINVTSIDAPPDRPGFLRLRFELKPCVAKASLEIRCDDR